MTQKPKKGEKKGFGSSSPRFDPAANTKSTTTRNPSDLSGSGHMGSVHPGRVSMTHNAMLHQGGNQEVRPLNGSHITTCSFLFKFSISA
jgi:hypothetical protein